MSDWEHLNAQAPTNEQQPAAAPQANPAPPAQAPATPAPAQAGSAQDPGQVQGNDGAPQGGAEPVPVPAGGDAAGAAAGGQDKPELKPKGPGELVKPQASKKQEPAPERWMKVDKVQYVTFVQVYDTGEYTEFALEDVIAIRQSGQVVTIYFTGAPPVDFASKPEDVDALMTAWRAKRAGRRNA